MRNKASRGLAALLLALAFLRCAPEATSGPCVFVNAERELTLRNTFDYADVARRGEGGNEVLILDGQIGGGEIEATRLDVVTGAQTPDAMPWDPWRNKWPVPGYTLFSGGSDEPADPLEQHGVIRTVDSGRRITGRKIEARRIVADERFTGTRRITFGSEVMLEQQLTMWPAGAKYEGFHAEPRGDRILCFCNDQGGTHVGVFSRARLARFQAGTATLEPFAAYGGGFSGRLEGNTVIITPRFRVAIPGKYRALIELRSDDGDKYIRYSEPLGPVEFELDGLTRHLGPPPWQVYMIEIARPVRRGREILLDRHYHLGRTSDFGLAGTPAPRPPSR